MNAGSAGSGRVRAGLAGEDWAMRSAAVTVVVEAKSCTFSCVPNEMNAGSGLLGGAGITGGGLNAAGAIGATGGNTTGGGAGVITTGGGGGATKGAGVGVGAA